MGQPTKDGKLIIEMMSSRIEIYWILCIASLMFFSILNKGAGGMKLASDFKLPVSCFSSNHVNFFSN